MHISGAVHTPNDADLVYDAHAACPGVYVLNSSAYVVKTNCVLAAMQVYTCVVPTTTDIQHV